MPFTLAHPAIIVPLARWKPKFFVLSALVVGSMSPDFEYFVHLRPVRTMGHDLIGIPLLCVPSGFLVLWVFESVMKGPLIQLLPGPHRRRLLAYGAPIQFIPASRLALILLSLALGAFSHIAWDSFTHEHGWSVQQLPPLATTLLSVGGQRLRVFKLLQYGCTAIGLALLACWYWEWFQKNPETVEPAGSTRSERARYAAITPMALVPCGFGLFAAIRASSGGFYRMTGQFIVAAISASCIVALGYCLLYRLIEGRARPTGKP